jgi:indole-3-glycerol phosphate synthase
MSTILDTIIETKKEEVQLLKKTGFAKDIPLPQKRPFIESLKKAPTLGIIAEVKKASPSKGIICPDFDPVKIAAGYEKAGAHCISVLTDKKYFQGCNEYLLDVRKAIALPVIRKEFIIDLIQIEETNALGADAMLLIVAALDKVQLRDLYDATLGMGIDPLIEVHDPWELETAMKLDPSLIGINNRNLKTFKVDLDITLGLMRYIPESVTVISESGIENGAQALELRNARVKGLLVGESLVKLDDPSVLLRELSCEGIL